MTGVDLDRDLVAYYEAEARAGRRTGHSGPGTAESGAMLRAFVRVQSSRSANAASHTATSGWFSLMDVNSHRLAT